MNESIEGANFTKKRLLVARITWGILFFMSLLYGAVGFIFTDTSIDFSGTLFDFSKPLERMCGAASVICLFAAWLVPGVLIRISEQKKGPTYGAKYVSYIIRLAFLLSVGTFGLLLALLAHDGNRSLPFYFASVVGFIVSFPRTKSFTLTEADIKAVVKESKVVYPPNPWFVKVIGFLLFALWTFDSILGGMFLKAEYQHTLPQDSFYRHFGKLGMKPFVLGLLVLTQNRTRIRQPILFWVMILLMSALCVPGILGFFDA